MEVFWFVVDYYGLCCNCVDKLGIEKEEMLEVVV